MPKKPDNKVGRSEGPAYAGGHQSPQQRRLTERGGAGKSDAERSREWKDAGEHGRPPVALGGSSQGQSDRMPTGGASRSNNPATNPAATPGHKNGTS